MPFGLPPDLTAYRLLQDQGSVIGGLLALIAGLLAYRAGKRQADAAERQMIAARAAEKRAVAIDALRGHQVLIAALQVTLDHLRALHAKADPNDKTQMKDGFSAGIYKPNISIFWPSLAATNVETAKAYIRLDANLEAYKATRSFDRAWHRNELNMLIEEADPLMAKLATMQDQISQQLGQLGGP